MNDKKMSDQTDYETAGIPTTPDQEDMKATDMLSDAVEEMVENVIKTFDPSKPAKKS